MRYGGWRTLKRSYIEAAIRPSTGHIGLQYSGGDMRLIAITCLIYIIGQDSVYLGQINVETAG